MVGATVEAEEEVVQDGSVASAHFHLALCFCMISEAFWRYGCRGFCARVIRRNDSSKNVLLDLKLDIPLDCALCVVISKLFLRSF